MRVAEVITGLGLGGAERALARRLAYQPEGTRTYVISTSTATSALEEQVRTTAEGVIALDANAGSRAHLRGHLQEIAPDLIITHNPREALRVLSDKAIRGLAPVVVVAHNQITSEYQAKALVLDALLPRINRHAALHLAVSSSAANGPQCRGARRTEVVWLGGEFDPETRPDTSAWPDGTRLRFLTLSRFSPQKNLEGLVDAAHPARDALRRAGGHISLIGEGERQPQVEARITHHGIGDLISIAGWVDSPDGALAGADALLIPSTNEGGPLTLYEALLAGTRVMATPTGAAPDLLQGEPGLIMLPGTRKEQLAAGLTAMAALEPVTDRERAERRARFVHVHASQQSARFYDLCQSVIDRG